MHVCEVYIWQVPILNSKIKDNKDRKTVFKVGNKKHAVLNKKNFFWKLYYLSIQIQIKLMISLY